MSNRSYRRFWLFWFRYRRNLLIIIPKAFRFNYSWELICFDTFLNEELLADVCYWYDTGKHCKSKTSIWSIDKEMNRLYFDDHLKTLLAPHQILFLWKCSLLVMKVLVQNKWSPSPKRRFSKMTNKILPTHATPNKNNTLKMPN